MDGLANQLLNVVVANERPDLEKQWADLVSEMGENALLLVSLEDTLLRELSSSQGNILDNHELIATLENTKSTGLSLSSSNSNPRYMAKILDQHIHQLHSVSLHI